MSKSPLGVARAALSIARDSGPAFEKRRGPRRFNNHQLFVLLVLRQFFRTDYRGIIAIIEDSAELRRILELQSVPHYSTLCYAEQRFAKKGALSEALLRACSTRAA